MLTLHRATLNPFYLLRASFHPCRKLSRELFLNKEFIFFVQCLGCMHTTAMLSPGNYKLKAPDFLSIISNNDGSKGNAQESPDLAASRPNLMSDTDAEVCSQHLEALAIKRLRREFRSSCFGDIISTTGISRSIAGLLYNIGRLGQLRSAALEFGDQNHWFWEASEADLDGLELQLDQILLGRNNLEKAFETSVNRLNHIEGQYNDDELQHTIDLNRYNDALVHCARIALLERVKCVNAEDERISASTQRVFNLCSLIHDSSHTAKLLVLPLYMVGMRDKTPETRSFVRSRLQSLDDIIVTDTRALLGILEERWAISMGPEISPPNKGM